MAAIKLKTTTKADNTKQQMRRCYTEQIYNVQASGSLHADGDSTLTYKKAKNVHEAKSGIEGSGKYEPNR